MVDLPTKAFLTITPDEGGLIRGYSTELTYDHCHSPTRSGVIMADFSTGFPTRRVVYDFDIRDEKEGLHVSSDDQVSVLDFSEARVRLQCSRDSLLQRIEIAGSETPAGQLLNQYAQNITELESLLANGKQDEFFKFLKGLGKSESQHFMGYVKNDQEFGWNGALLYPEKADLVGINLTENKYSHNVSKAFHALKSKNFTFWPIPNLPSGMEQVYQFP